MRFQFELFPNSLELKVNFDGVVCSGSNRHSLASQNSDRGQIGRCRRIDDNSIDALVAQGLTAQIKQRTVKVE